MDKIVKYVDQIFKDVELTKELKLQKEEFIDHLNDKVLDLLNQGMDEAEAYQKITLSLGSIETVRADLGLIPQLSKNEIQLMKKLKTLYWCAYVALISIIICFELFWGFNSLFDQPNIAKACLFTLITLSVVLVVYIQSQIASLSSINSAHIKILKTIYLLVMFTVGIFLLGWSFSMPSMTKNAIDLSSYIKEGLRYLFISIILFLLISYLLDRPYQRLFTIQHNKASWIQKIDQSIVTKYLKYYGYIPIILFFLFIFPNSTIQFLFMFCFVLVAQIIEDCYHYYKERDNKFLLRLYHIFILIIMIFYALMINLGFITTYHEIILAILFIPTLILTIILFILYFTKMNKNHSWLYGVIQYLPYLSCQLFILIIMTKTSIQTRPTLIVEYDLPLISLIVMIYLIIHGLYVSYNVRNIDTKKNNKPIAKHKWSFIVVSIIVILFIFQVPKRIYFKQVLFSTNQRVSDIYIQDKSQKDGKHVFVYSYKFSNGEYCIGYHEYGVKLGLYYQFSYPYKDQGECYNGEITMDTINASHSYTEGSDYFELVVFGKNEHQYRELVYTYQWGEEVRVPIDDSEIFYYSKMIPLPPEYKNRFMGEDFYHVDRR